MATQYRVFRNVAVRAKDTKELLRTESALYGLYEDWEEAKKLVKIISRSREQVLKGQGQEVTRDYDPFLPDRVILHFNTLWTEVTVTFRAVKEDWLEDAINEANGVCSEKEA